MQTYSQIPVRHQGRLHGQSHYNFWNRSLGVAIDFIGVIWLMKRPLACEIVPTRTYEMIPTKTPNGQTIGLNGPSCLVSGRSTFRLPSAGELNRVVPDTLANSGLLGSVAFHCEVFDPMVGLGDKASLGNTRRLLVA